ncbi:MAG TPA: phosphoribosylglycinamide formyltransferase [Rhodobacteraceae bacterium]|nr:phosphoribosylglycinamide formyltransferase [Paracoccaceae bacterium]HBV55776.1 phosphoribosylglycinamide formyltransferase [Paracoccaceae bacterium]
MTQRVALFISGGGSNMIRLVEDMKGDHPARPVVVLSNVPDAGGIPAAARMGVPTVTVDHRPFGKDRAAFEAALMAELKRFRPDVICLAGFMRVLTADFVRPFAGRMLNIHPSLLPKYKGLHTHQRALEAGDHEAGCTVHLVTPELDDGPILGQARVPVLPDDTEATLAARVLAREHQLYPAVLRRFVSGQTEPLFL